MFTSVKRILVVKHARKSTVSSASFIDMSSGLSGNTYTKEPTIGLCLCPVACGDPYLATLLEDMN